MLQSIILFIALTCAFTALLHLSNTYIEALIIKKDANTRPTLLFGILSIITWCVFYYLTH